MLELFFVEHEVCAHGYPFRTARRYNIAGGAVKALISRRLFLLILAGSPLNGTTASPRSRRFAPAATRFPAPGAAGERVYSPRRRRRSPRCGRDRKSVV